MGFLYPGTKSKLFKIHPQTCVPIKNNGGEPGIVVQACIPRTREGCDFDK
jgi:hypothetical protein